MLYVNPYVKDTYRTNQPEGRGSYIRLDQNENPDGIPQWLFDIIMENMSPATFAMYPEEGIVTEKYAKMVGVNPDNVSLTDGSVVAMGYLIHVFGQPGKNLIAVNPTFNMYHAYAKLNGMTSSSIDYESDYTFDINKILDAIDETTGIVVLVNPNMPVGNVYSQKDIEKVVQKAAKYNAFVIIDEAYHYFYNESSIPLIREYDNLAVLRTFSKMLSIPALRLGVIIGPSDVVRYVNNMKPHYTVNTIALMCAEAIIDNIDKVLSELEEKFKHGMEFVLKSLSDKQYQVIPSNGCFICIRPKYKPIEYLMEELKKKNILVLRGSKGLLENHIRLSVCDKKYMELFTEALFEIDQP